jgi:hypothetical protein
MDTGGSRNDLMNRLLQAGVKCIDTKIITPPLISQNYNPSSVCIGTLKSKKEHNKLSISNPIHELISGDFGKKVVTLHDCLHISCTVDFSCDTDGTEGDIRRHRSKLYMYRSTDVIPGWYPIRFDRVEIV